MGHVAGVIGSYLTHVRCAGSVSMARQGTVKNRSLFLHKEQGKLTCLDYLRYQLKRTDAAQRKAY